MKFHPLSWRTSHTYVLVDRFEDITPPEQVHANNKCDRKVTLYGYLRGCNMKKGNKVHIAGVGDYGLTHVTGLPDPCPLPSAAKKKGLRDREKLFYAPMSGVGDLLYDKDAVYININDHFVQFSKADDENIASTSKGNERDVGEVLVKSLQNTKYSINEKLESSFINLFRQNSIDHAVEEDGELETLDSGEDNNEVDSDGSESSDQDETDRETGRSKQISTVPIQLSIYSPNVVNLTLIDLPGLTKVAVEGQPDSIVHDIENMVRSYIEKPNCIILAISPANQDIATSDAIKISREVDPTGERTIGVLTKIDLMDKGTDAVDMLEGRAYRLKFPWIGVVNRSQADINKNVDMIAARRREREYFNSTPEYKHLANRMGSEHLAKMLSKHLETVIKSKIPGILSLINKTINEIETELARLGKPVATGLGGFTCVCESCK
ncbi:hypothetical protein RYX36_032243 [Vicia faba]